MSRIKENKPETKDIQRLHKESQSSLRQTDKEENGGTRANGRAEDGERPHGGVTEGVNNSVASLIPWSWAVPLTKSTCSQSAKGPRD